ncbi:hypothetical protein EB796_007767 [Bugula neritina]|uniref:Uncharacterized protein n=1 Tax=Bugula neritina TaxID=10212 RepID=A0A7J7K8N9_BUGNE|nr:hypothetical protein EB796_007767 [Bugula neritina]
MELWQKGLVFCILVNFYYSKGEKPAIGYTLTNDMATKDNWAGSYLNFPVRDLTLCFWYKFTDLSDRRQEHNILSAATATEDNLFYIRFYTRVSELDIGWLGEVLTVSGSFSPDLNVWMYYCLTVSMRFGNSGRFSDDQVALGSISCLNFWSRAYTENELTEFSDCLSEGDVFSLKPGVVTLHGGISEEYVPPVTTTQPTTTTRALTTTQPTTTTREAAWNNWLKFQKVPEVWKSGLIKFEFKVPSPLACVSICLMNHCKEINYCIEDGICEMGWGNSTGTLSTYAGAVYYVMESYSPIHQMLRKV